MFASVGATASLVFFFSSRRRHTRFDCDWSSDVCSSDLAPEFQLDVKQLARARNHLGGQQGVAAQIEEVVLDADLFDSEHFSPDLRQQLLDRKSTRLNSSHSQISYAVFCLKKKKKYYNTI